MAITMTELAAKRAEFDAKRKRKSSNKLDPVTDATLAAEKKLDLKSVYTKEGKYAGKQIVGTKLPKTLTWVAPK